MVLLIAGMTAAGDARGWDRADAFAEQSREPLRRMGMLLAALGMAGLIAVSPALVAMTHGTRGFSAAVAGWLGFALGAGMFLMVFGLTTIALPALGELAARGAVHPQQIVDEFIRQPGIYLGFLGANAAFLSWVPLGLGLSACGRIAAWGGRLVAVAACISWLSFLHVPGLEPWGGLAWPASIVLLGVLTVRGARTPAPAANGQ